MSSAPKAGEILRRALRNGRLHHAILQYGSSAPALEDRAACAKNPRLSSSAAVKSLPRESATAWVIEFPPTGMLRTNMPSSRAIIRFVKREPTFIIMTSFSRPQYFQAL